MNVPQLRFEGFEGEWGIYRLNEFFEFIDGDRGPNYPNEKDFKNEGYCVFLNAHNISENGLTFNHINWLTEEKHKKLRKGTVERGDLILTSRGSKLGKLALYDETVPYEIMRINSAMLLIRKIRSELDSHYSISLFKESLLPRFINANKVGSAQPHITVKDIKRLKFSMPQDINEQKRIAHLFRLLNQRIIKQQEKIEKLEQFKKGMMQKIFSQELRFKDEDGGEFPEWKSFRLSELLKERQEKCKKRNLKVHSVAVRAGIVNQITHLGRSFAAKDVSNYSVVKYGDIVYTKSPTGDFPYGIIKQSHIKEDVIVSPLYGIYVPKNFYIGYILHSYFMYNSNTNNYLYSIVQKGAKNTINITNQTFISKNLIFPSSEIEQKKVAIFLKKIDKKIEKEKLKLVVLEEQRKSFMQKVFI